jgi:hypothetical protein
MTTTTTPIHPIKGRRSASTRIDPYTVDEITLTLAEWREAQLASAKRAHPAGRGRRGDHLHLTPVSPATG